MSNEPEEEGTENIAAVTNEAHEPTDIINNAFQQFKIYIDSQLEYLTNTLQPKASAESKPLLATKKLQRETEGEKLQHKANLRQFIHNAEVQDHVLAAINCLIQERPDSAKV